MDERKEKSDKIKAYYSVIGQNRWYDGQEPA